MSRTLPTPLLLFAGAVALWPSAIHRFGGDARGHR
jgi:hypothetical protein